MRKRAFSVMAESLEEAVRRLPKCAESEVVSKHLSNMHSIFRDNEKMNETVHHYKPRHLESAKSVAECRKAYESLRAKLHTTEIREAELEQKNQGLVSENLLLRELVEALKKAEQGLRATQKPEKVVALKPCV